MARQNLATLHDSIGRLASEAAHGRHTLRIHEGIPGGDALVMVAAASAVRGRTGQPPRLTGQYELPGDPQPPLDVLVAWEEHWRAQTAHPTGLTPTMDRVVDYLDRHLSDLAKDPAFPDFARDLVRTLHRVENVLHDSHRPESSRVPCWDCGTRLVKQYADHEDHDHWSCPACGQHYDQERYERATHVYLDATQAEKYVTVSTATAATGRPEQTLRTWIRRELVATARDPDTGRLLVWWPDVRVLHFATPSRRRTIA